MKLKAGQTCNIFTYANSEIEWFAKDLSVNYWDLTLQKVDPNKDGASDSSVDDFSNWL